MSPIIGTFLTFKAISSSKLTNISAKAPTPVGPWTRVSEHPIAVEVHILHSFDPTQSPFKGCFSSHKDVWKHLCVRKKSFLRRKSSLNSGFLLFLSPSFFSSSSPMDQEEGLPGKIFIGVGSLKILKSTSSLTFALSNRWLSHHHCFHDPGQTCRLHFS